MAQRGGKKRIKEAQAELKSLGDPTKARDDALASARNQIVTLAKVVGIALVVIWLIALGFWSGLNSTIPLWIAGVLTVAAAVGAVLIRRNMAKSAELGDLIGDPDMSPEERASRIAKIQVKVDKGDVTAILTKAQIEMHDDAKVALATLESANLEKAPKMVANQVRGMRAMIHLNHGEVQAARQLADAIPLEKTPDPKARANLAGIVAEAWARSGNPIEAGELMEKYDPNASDMADVKVQLWRARAFSSAHRNDLGGMRKAMKQLQEVSPQLLGIFVGQKRVHPLLAKEARKRLEKAGFARPQIQMARR
ncbi:MAG: hypothetical protein AAF449_02355 [Myxococcota bacterium]